MKQNRGDFLKVIGIIGGIGSGKSKITEYLEKNFNAYAISSDLIGHEIILKGKPAYEQIVDFFGRNILDENDEINRKILGDIVFKNPANMEKLNSITHPLILERIIQEIKRIKEENKYSFITLEAALIVGENWVKLVDTIWLITCPIDIRIERLMKSRNLSKEKINNILSNQENDDELKKYADIVINNSLELTKTLEQVKIEVLKLLEANHEEK